MKIGLIDADLMWTKRTNGRRYGKGKADVFPNLAIMKLGAYHQAKNDEVEWYNALVHYDMVYVSKVFSTTPINGECINADIVVFGGTGFQIQLVNGIERFIERPYIEGNYPNQVVQFSPRLPDEAEHIMPMYSLYPMVKDTAIGYLSRGCPNGQRTAKLDGVQRGCKFCHVGPKEGPIPTKWQT